LGIKGKIDISVESQGSKKILPLEIKTGKPSFSAEHSGQVANNRFLNHFKGTVISSDFHLTRGMYDSQRYP